MGIPTYEDGVKDGVKLEELAVQVGGLSDAIKEVWTPDEKDEFRFLRDAASRELDAHRNIIKGKLTKVSYEHEQGGGI